MAKGSIAKQEITNKILETFSGSFCFDKEIRIPYVENGETLQIKCVLTCAKVNVENGGNANTPSEVKTTSTNFSEITEEEKKEVKSLIDELGL